MARDVLRVLRSRDVRASLYEIPYRYTLQALVEHPEIAQTDYSMPSGRGQLDVDLDALDEHLRRRYPCALVFEFHNAEDTHPMLGIDPAKPVSAYEVGPIGPGVHPAREVGTWRNIDLDGRPGKYVIEVPACYVAESPHVRARRRERLARLREAGYDDDPRWLHYLEHRADIAASRCKGYLEPCLAEKIADWIMRCREASS